MLKHVDVLYTTIGAHTLPRQTVAFDKLRVACNKISESHTDMPLAEVVAMYSSLLDFTVNVYKNDLTSVDSVLQACCQVRAMDDHTAWYVCMTDI